MIASLTFLMSVAHSFAPTGDSSSIADGPRPLVGNEPQRVYPIHAPVQRALLRSPAWQSFVKGEGEGWTATFDEHSGTPRTMWGRGIPMPTEEAALTQALRDFMERHADVLGLRSGSLQLVQANYFSPTDVWYVQFAEMRDDAPVYRGGVSARVAKGNLVLLQVATTGEAPMTGAWRLTSRDAVRTAIASGPVPDAAHTDPVAVRQALDVDTATGREVRRTWMVRTRTANPPGIWVSFVDAETGAMLNVHNEVRFASGIVEGIHHERGPQTALIAGPVPLAIVDSGNGTGLT
ncbi:MAG: hypothetical protein AAGA48_39410, partial [Myxococcota bacterium]